MHPAYEQYTSGCQIISLLTNLEPKKASRAGIIHERSAACGRWRFLPHPAEMRVSTPQFL